MSPLLQQIQLTWLSSAKPSRSLVSLSLQSTNRVLAETACSTNKTVNLAKPHHPKPSRLCREIRKSQTLLLQSHRKIIMFKGPQSHFEHLKEEHNKCKQRHRKLLRRRDAPESCQRDSDLFNILQKNPSKVFNSVRKSKQSGTRQVNKLTVDGKMYTGDTVRDGFYDSLLNLKSFDPGKIQDPVAF